MTASGEMRAVAAYIRGGHARMVAGVKPVVAKGALNIKNSARANLGGTKTNAWLLRAITYDLTDGGLGAEIGPDQAISGLGLGRELGSSGTPPHPFLFPAGDLEEPKFLAAAEDAAAAAWEHLP